MIKQAASLCAYLLISSIAFAQSPPKKPLPAPPPTGASLVQQPTSLATDSSAVITALRTEQESVRQRITSSETEDQKYTGGLIKVQIQSRIAVLRMSDALLTQKIAALQTGARAIIEAPATKPDPAIATSLEAEATTQKLKIEQARVDADRYSGGLIKAQKESTIATMESTLAMLEQRGLTAKYGLALVPASAGTATGQPSTTQSTRNSAPSAKLKAQDEILSLRLVDKKFTAQKYQEFIFFDIEFVADKLQKPARAIKGTLNINDLFGARQMGLSWTIDRPVTPGETFVESGQGFKYNQFMDRHQWAKTTDRSNMAVTYTIESILYQDGTREDF